MTIHADRVVTIPADAKDCNRDPRHDGHDECQLAWTAGKTFVVAYSFVAGVGISEYLSRTGEWIVVPEFGLIPDECWFDTAPRT